MLPEGLRQALNEIRETSIVEGTLYAKYVEEIQPSTNIGEWASPILEVPVVMNEFIPNLVQKIVKTQIETRLFNNPLKVLEGDMLPLGSIGEEIFINPIVRKTFQRFRFCGLACTI